VRITEIFEERRQTFSFEFFPPKTEKGLANLYKKMDQLAELRPDFCTVTCGAGGSDRGKTVEIADHCNRNMDCPSVVHVTCAWAAKAQIREMLDETRDLGMENVMALRGDPPQGESAYQSRQDGFNYAHELVQMIREEAYPFAIGVAGYPEGHVENPDHEADLRHLKHKVDQGADFIATQLFFDNADFFGFVERCRAIGITQRIVAGVMPVMNFHKILEFCEFCGAKMPDKLRALMEPIADDPQQVLEAGTRYAAEQISELLEGGADGVHLYTLNKTQGIQRMYELLGPILDSLR